MGQYLRLPVRQESIAHIVFPDFLTRSTRAYILGEREHTYIYKGYFHNNYMSHEKTRIFRMNEIKKIFKKHKKVDKEKLIAELSMQWGASRRTILEYIKTVKNAIL